MRAIVAPVCSLSLAALFAAAGPAARAQGAAQARDRQIYISVTTDQGAPAPGLTAADVTVKEDGVTREVLRVEPATTPLRIALLADDSQAAGPDIANLRPALKAFVTTVLAASPQSMLSLETYGERPTPLVPATSNAAQIERGIDRIFSRPGSGAYLLDAIEEAAKTLKQNPAPRANIVAFVDESSTEFSNLSYQRVRDDLQAAGATLWSVVLQGRPQDETTDEIHNRSVVLGDVSAASGGTRSLVLARTGLEPTFRQLGAQLTSEYVVTYGRPDGLIPPTKLSVGVTRRGLHVAAPAWPGQ